MRCKCLLVAVLLVAGNGCSTMSNTTKGAAVGTGVGALGGAALGSLTGNPKTGAVLGGLFGGVLGGAIGHDTDVAEKRDRDAAAYAAAHPPMSLQDVVTMAHNHISDDLIIRQIETTNSTFLLSTQDITYLRSQGVSERVVGFMQARRGGPPAPVVVRPVRPVYVVEDPAPVSVGVGIYSGPRYYHRRCW